MAYTDTFNPDTTCVPDETSLADGPFTSLRYHFGMLLGVDDFATEQRYHRSKMRLHNAWLHRAGVVWGLAVTAELDRRELRVGAGLALDATGRELHLDALSCVDVAAWLDEQDPAPDTEATATGGVKLDAHVELSFCACATRQVPAIADPCEGADTDTAYSRTFETVEIRLVPGLAELPPPPYPRLRLLFGIEEGVPAELPDRDEVIAARSDPDNLLANFREFANRDAAELDPALTEDGEHAVPFPARDDEPLVLANVRNITLEGTGNDRKLTGAEIDLAPRRSHVATATIQELLCSGILGAGGTSAGSGGGAASADAGGPRVESVKLDRDAKTIVLRATKPFAKASVDAEPFRVSFFGASGWRPIKTTPKPSDDGLEITIGLKTGPGPDLVRILARGTGQTPLLGADNVPFAGSADAPPGSADNGNDYVQMFPS
ncbi:MAG: hypothetical protein M3540_12595 [Actinomycetota bacterium]|nr:hypothetical protein [Actinomycetota bacterium]